MESEFQRADRGGSGLAIQGTTSWEVQQQQDAIRSVYQRAVVIPLANVEQLWREYDQFENKLNKVTVSLRTDEGRVDRHKGAGGDN
jgi:hypothetical protein